MDIEKSVPEIRFKGFGGEWENLTLGDLGSVAMNKRVFKHQTSVAGEVPFFKIGTFGKQPDAFIRKALFDEYKAKYPHPVEGDLLLSASGSIGRVVEYKGEEQYFQDSNIVWLKHDGRIENTFLKVFYSMVRWGGLEGSTIKRLYNKNILDTEISTPERQEQIQIGGYFQKLDNLINQHQQKHDKLSNIKKAMLEKMFPKEGETIPEIRFKGFSGEWEERPLSEIAQVIDPHPSHRAPDAVDNGVPFIGIGDISDAGLVDFKNVRIVPRHIYNEHSVRYTIESGDFAYGRVASVGKIIDLSNNVGNEYTYSPTMAIVKPKSLYPAFLKSYLGTEVFKGHVDNKISGSTRKSLGVQDFRNLPVLFPSVDEQAAIGNYFQKLDALINQHQQQITKLNNIKQACLSKMFV